MKDLPESSSFYGTLLSLPTSNCRSLPKPDRDMFHTPHNALPTISPLAPAEPLFLPFRPETALTHPGQWLPRSGDTSSRGFPLTCLHVLRGFPDRFCIPL